jgi:hypothetical protein
MDPSCAKGICDLVHSKFEWKQEKLEFCLTINGNEQVAYHGAVIKATNSTFPSPYMKQKETIALFKHQALKQGVHLMIMASHANSKGYSSRTPIQRDHQEDFQTPDVVQAQVDHSST